MRIIRDIYNLPEVWNGSSVTIGNFDSLHEGHQQLIFECNKHARRNKIPSMLITFEPCADPLSLKFEKYSFRMINLRERFLTLKNLGIDYLLLLKFSEKLLSMSATSFIQEIIIQKLMAKVIIIGDDFQFGKLRLGNSSLLHTANLTYSLQTIKKPTFMHKCERLSSSRIRFRVRNTTKPRKKIYKCI